MTSLWRRSLDAGIREEHRQWGTTIRLVLVTPGALNATSLARSETTSTLVLTATRDREEDVRVGTTDADATSAAVSYTIRVADLGSSRFPRPGDRFEVLNDAGGVAERIRIESVVARASTTTLSLVGSRSR